MQETKTSNERRHEFYKLYRRVIVPEISKYEEERKNKLFLVVTLGAVGIIAEIILGIMTTKCGKSTGGIIGNVMMFGGILLFIIIRIIKRSFEMKIKEKIMPQVCKCFGNLRWSNGFYPSGHYFRDAGLIKEYDGVDYDDIFQGEFNGVKLEVIEPQYYVIRSSHSSRGSTAHKVTIFDGIIIKIKMNKDFKSHTVVVPDSLLHGTPIKGLRHTILEDTQFEKKFDVFTNDEVEARYLITPSFMERLFNLRTSFRADKVSCAFYKNHLIVALSTDKDLFSVCSLFKPVNDSKQFFDMYDEMASTIELIDYFKLDKKLGL